MEEIILTAMIAQGAGVVAILLGSAKDALSHEKHEPTYWSATTAPDAFSESAIELQKPPEGNSQPRAA